MSNSAARLDILIDIQSKLGELLKTQQGFREAKREAETFGNFLKQGLGIGSGIAIAQRGISTIKSLLFESVREAFRLAEATKAMAGNLQMDIAAFQTLGELVKDADGNIESLVGALNQQRASMVEARDSTSGAASALRILGLDFGRLQTMRPERQFEALAKAVASAHDKEAAFAAATEILGERHVKNLRKALQDLAEQGFDKVKESAEGANKFMSPQAIAQLAALQKMFGDNWDKFKAKVGEDVASVSSLFFGKADVPSQAAPTGEELRAAANRVAQEQALVAAQTRLAALQRRADVIGSDPTKNEDAKRTSLLALLSDQEDALNEILALRGGNAEWLDKEIKSLEVARDSMRLQSLYSGEVSDHYRSVVTRLERLQGIQRAGVMPLAIERKETDRGRADEVDKLKMEVAGLRNQVRSLLGAGTENDFEKIRKQLRDQMGDSVGAISRGRSTAMSPGEGLEAGFMQWQLSVGSAGQQIANTISGTIGSSLNLVSDSLLGLIEKTKTWGDVGRAAGQMFLQSLIQLGVQMAANWAISKVISTEEKKEAASNTAAKAAEGGMKSIAQLGPILGPIAFAAGIAAIFSLLGGFRANGGPVKAGVPYVVGEREAEVFVPSEAGTILPSVSSFARTFPGAAPEPTFKRSVPGMAPSRPVHEQRRRERVVVVVGDLIAARNLARDPEWDTMVVDSVMRRRGQILNA